LADILWTSVMDDPQGNLQAPANCLDLLLFQEGLIPLMVSQK